MGMSKYLLITALSINDFCSPIKSYKLADWIKKLDLIDCFFLPKEHTPLVKNVKSFIK